MDNRFGHIDRDAFAAWLIAAGLLVVLLILFFQTWYQPPFERHAFRQTQTALTAYWLGAGSDFFNYITPVVGYPWAVPFEIPWYQWVVAKVSGLTGLPLDPSGRLVSFLFSIATIWPAVVVLRILGCAGFGAAAFAALYILCPQYAFWGRSFMIETAAVFFAMAFLATTLQFLRTSGPERLGWLALALITGVIAGTQKVTTFAAFYLAACVSVAFTLIAPIIERHRASPVRLRYGLLLGALAVLVIPAVATGLWTLFSDGIKELNPFGRLLTSAALRGWNFGTLHQRLSAEMWNDVIVTRVLAFASIGVWPAVLLGSVALIWLRGRALWAFAAAIALFLTPFLVFTNLHLVHDYYQTANVIFLIGAVAILLDQVHRRQRVLAFVLLAVVLGSEWHLFSAGYLGIQRSSADHAIVKAIEVSRIVRAEVPANQGLLVFGFDWSSEVAYYSERKTMTVPEWPIKTEVLAEPGRFLGGTPLGGVVACPTAGTSVDTLLGQGLARIVDGFRPIPSGDCVVYVRPAPGNGDSSHASVLVQP